MKFSYWIFLSLFISSFTASADDSKSSIEHMHEWLEGIYSGGRPFNEASFKYLSSLDINTIISVDAIKPDLKMAEKHGLHYFHVPIGYDEVNPDAAAAIVKIINEQQSGIYIHCHHGIHRAPASAATALISGDYMDKTAALKIMHKIGTSEQYQGLWKSVLECSADYIKGRNPDIYGYAPVKPLAELMAKLDTHWDYLKTCSDNNWKSTIKNPDIVPINEALLIHEFFKEIQERTDPEQNITYHNLLESAVKDTDTLHKYLQKNKLEDSKRLVNQIQQNCITCHKQFRN